MWKNVEKCGGVWGGVGGGKNAEKHGNTRKNMEKREKATKDLEVKLLSVGL